MTQVQSSFEFHCSHSVFFQAHIHQSSHRKGDAFVSSSSGTPRSIRIANSDAVVKFALWIPLCSQLRNVTEVVPVVLEWHPGQGVHSKRLQCKPCRAPSPLQRRGKTLKNGAGALYDLHWQCTGPRSEPRCCLQSCRTPTCIPTTAVVSLCRTCGSTTPARRPRSVKRCPIACKIPCAHIS